ncbi:MAG: M23 family metallopeptidase [Rikenellaceae bacterium]|jgi:murein DD-endopeptidase MepM/ murein hydrolase activator NlpD|nr:M23 family metallopeptidase [Rikenellaceae bacterium]
MNRTIIFRAFGRLNEKRRLSVRDGHTDKELWHIYLSPLNIVSASLALLLVVLVAVATLVAYTSILDFIPGYPGNRSRETLIANIMRLDSLERRLSSLQVYSDNMSLILDGKIPTTRGVAQSSDSAKFARDNIVRPSREDSLLRAAIESGSLFSLPTRAAKSMNVTAKTRFVAPIKGVLSSRFNPKENRYGVEIASAANQQVVAVADGTVALSIWTPNDGALIMVQHVDNMLSIYRRSSTALKTTGAMVKAGEVLGYTGEGATGGAFEFELWKSGLPVDPESYIVF